MEQPLFRTTSERVDDIPLIIYWLLRMRVHIFIDQFLPKPHGNRQGLSYGQLAILLLAYILTQADHRLCTVEKWVLQHRRTLQRATGWHIADKDCTDDRLADLTGLLGNEEHRYWESIEAELGQHLIRAYALPTDAARCDTSSFSVYHQTDEDGTKFTLLRRGHSKDRRPDLLQYRQMLATLDPAGMPLVTATLSGNGADDPIYVPAWRRMAGIIGHTDFLFVADCKAASRANRAHIQHEGGIYCFPLAMTGHQPAILRDWVLDPPVAAQDIFLKGQEPGETPACQGFEMALGTLWQDPDTKEWYRWLERWLVIRSEALAVRRIRGLHRRLARAEQSLAKLAKKPGDDPAALAKQVQTILKRHNVADFLTVDVQVHVRQEQRYVGPGRPGPNRTTRIVEHKELGLSVHRQIQAIQEAETLAGWRLYVTNASAGRLSLAQAVNYYREEWQPERGFHRFKRGALPALPIYLRNEEGISGLMFLLTIALRVFTLMEFVVRRRLAEKRETLAGLYDGNPKRKTNRPTAERLLGAFRNITLYCHPDGTYEMSPLSSLQRQILGLMSIAESIYTVPESAPG